MSTSQLPDPPMRLSISYVRMLFRNFDVIQIKGWGNYGAYLAGYDGTLFAMFRDELAKDCGYGAKYLRIPQLVYDECHREDAEHLLVYRDNLWVRGTECNVQSLDHWVEDPGFPEWHMKFPRADDE